MKKTFAFALIIWYSSHCDAQWAVNATLTGGSIITDLIEFKGILYAGVDKGGIYRSENAGDSWSKTTVPSQGNFVHFVEHNNELLAVSFGAINRTSDGISWTQEGGPPAFINDVSSDGTNLFAATHLGIYQSSDAGQNWTLAPDVATQMSMKSIAVSGQTVWAAAENPNGGALFRSSNAGGSWTKVTKGTIVGTEIFIEGTVVYVYFNYDGLYKSADNGANWQSVRPSAATGHFFGTPAALYHFSNGRLAVSPNDGASWSEPASTMPGYNTQHLYATATYVFVGCWGGGVYRNLTAGTGTWTRVNTGLAVTEVNQIAVSDGTIFVGTDFSFIRSSGDNGATWDQKLDTYALPSGTARKMLFARSDLYVGQGGGGVQRSGDRGATWTLKNTGLTNMNIVGLAATPAAIFAGTDDGVFRSANRGDNWTKKSTGITGGIRTVYADGLNVYAGTWSGLYWSANDGESWAKISTGLPDESIGYMTKVGSTIFAGTQFNGLHKTSNGGAAWEPVNANFVLGLTARKNDIFMSSFNGKLFVSSDLGATWSDISSGLPDAVIPAIAFSETNILIGTASANGVWSRLLTEILPPYFSFSTATGGEQFKVGQALFVKSDQPLHTPEGTALQTADLSTHITVKDSDDQPAAFTASIDEARKLITITITAAIPGEAYKITVSPLKNVSGLESASSTSSPFMSIDNFIPVVSNVTISGSEDEDIQFAASTFIGAFDDEDQDPLVKVMIKSLPQHGTLKANGSAVSVNAEVTAAGLAQLSYSPNGDYFGPDEWKWNGSDGKSYAASDATVLIDVSPVTAVVPENEGVTVYPNPVENVLVVNVPAQGVCRIAIFDLSGRQIKGVFEAFQSSSIDLSAAAAGVYILRVEYEGNVHVRRVIKIEGR